jgi:hypothetical protein
MYVSRSRSLERTRLLQLDAAWAADARRTESPPVGGDEQASENTYEGQLMASITVKMKDGTERKFPHEGRAGGSWTKKVTYEGAFVVIEDEWQQRTAIPASEVAEVVETPNRSW